jgi:hypothetical protein
MNDSIIAQAASQGTLIEQTRAVAEVAAAVQAARQFPRSEVEARTSMLEVCGRLTVASRAFYEVPNRGAGPSVHLARELARVFGNIDYGVRELSRDDERGESEMQVWAIDLQTNARSSRSFIAPHVRMVKGDRKRLTDIGDIYLSNQNIGARAVRECIFAVLPGWFVAEAEGRCKQTIRDGDGTPLGERITRLVETFAEEFKTTAAQLEKFVGAPVGKWSWPEFARLSRVYSSVTVDGIPVSSYFTEEPLNLTTLASAPLDPADPSYVAPETMGGN